jgi:hypothetical protein
LLVYFPYFNQIKVGLWDRLAVCVTPPPLIIDRQCIVCVPTCPSNLFFFYAILVRIKEKQAISSSQNFLLFSSSLQTCTLNWYQQLLSIRLSLTSRITASSYIDCSSVARWLSSQLWPLQCTVRITFPSSSCLCERTLSHVFCILNTEVTWCL